MNILLAPVSYLPFMGGVPISAHNLAKAYAKMGHHVVIVTPKLEPAHPSFEMIDGIEVHRMSFAFPWRLLWQRPQEDLLQFFLRWPLDLQRLLRLLVQKHVEVIHIHSLTGPQFPYMLFAQLFVGSKIVISLRGSEFFRLNTWHNRVRRLLLRYGQS